MLQGKQEGSGAMEGSGEQKSGDRLVGEEMRPRVLSEGEQAPEERAFYLILTIDTEGDNLWEDVGGGRSFKNIEKLPEFQEFCQDLGLKPTYLVAYEVIEDDKAREVIQQLAKYGDCEIGAHLHAWLTPPYYPPLDNSGKHTYLHEYPEDIRAAKLETVTKAIEDAIGARPTSYRGGRWSMDAFTMRWLDSMGYLVDTTVTPFVSWARTPGACAGGPNFSFAPHQPYHPDPDDPRRPGSLSILEVPTSHRPKGLVPYWLYKSLGRVFGNNARTWRLALRYFLNRLSRIVHPTPITESAERLKWLVRRLLKEKTMFLNLAFHSSELMAGGAPWVQTAEHETTNKDVLAELCAPTDRRGLFRLGGCTLIGFAKALGVGMHGEA